MNGYSHLEQRVKSLIIAYELSHMCGVLSHCLRTIVPVNAELEPAL